MTSILQDLRYAVRLLARNPWFTLLAVMTLGLGIGANTTIFSVVNSVLIDPLPYRDSDRLMMVWHQNRKLNDPHYPFSYPNFSDIRERSRSFDRMAAVSPVWNLIMRGDGDPERIEGHFVSAQLFDILGVEAGAGRVFTESEDSASSGKVIVISHRLWQQRFGGRENIIGRQVQLDSDRVTVIGVMPEGFQFLEKVDLWIPLAHNPVIRRGRAVHLLRVLGHLRPDASAESAGSEVGAIAAALERKYPESNTDLGALAISLRQELVGEVRGALLLLWGAVGFVLLIACANVANLLLSRGYTRRREVAIRTALGASRWRLIRQMLTESVLLASFGGLLGLMMAVWGIDLVRGLGANMVPRIDQVGLDTSVLVFTILASLLTGIIFGLAPALSAMSINSNDSLKEGARNTGMGRRWFGRALVVAEIALTLILLVGAGLLIRSFTGLMRVDPGFRTDHLLTLQMALPAGQYDQTADRVRFYRDFFAEIGKIPGVESAGGVTRLPMRDGISTMLEIEGRPVPQGERPEVQFRRASIDYFRTMRIPVDKGRGFTRQDAESGAFPVLINQAAARLYWPNEDPIGRRIRFFSGNPDAPWAEIIGVVGDIRHFGLDEEVRPEVYMNFDQGPPGNPMLAIRTTVDDPTSIVPALRRLVRSLNGDITLYDIESMESLVAEKLAERRFTMNLLGIFAALALVMAVTGIYGVVSHSVTQRTSEIGVRIALGAQTSDILRMVIGQGIGLILAGLILGLAGSLALSRYLASLIVNLSILDATAYLGAALLLVAVSLMACLIPALRATKVDPTAALRHE